jgi:hypothetical protein
MMFLLDVAPAISGSTVGLGAAAVFLVVFLAVAYIAFRMLRKTVKMAFRIAIVAIILAVAVAGSVALWAVGSGSTDRPRPSRSR